MTITQTTDWGQSAGDTQVHAAPVGSLSLDSSQDSYEDHAPLAAVEGSSSAASHRPAETQVSIAGGGTNSDPGQGAVKPQDRHARVGHSSERGQRSLATHTRSAPLGTDSPQGHSMRDTQCGTALGGDISPAATIPGTDSISPSSRRGPILFNPLLALLADSLSDLEAQRIATDNRLRSLTRTETDADGEMRGLGLDARSPQVARMQAIADGIAELEHRATLDLQREMRATPFAGWVKEQKGIGEKQAARLLATIGDPYWNDLHDRPRTVSELWAYAGYAVHGGHAQRRQKGVQQNWNDGAKMRVFVMAESCVKQLTGEYRKVYDAARLQYADAVHPHDCVRCGPAGKPALAGTPLSAGHQHARALRRVSKEILRDLWLIARDVHHAA